MTAEKGKTSNGYASNIPLNQVIALGRGGYLIFMAQITKKMIIFKSETLLQIKPVFHTVARNQKVQRAVKQQQADKSQKRKVRCGVRRNPGCIERCEN